MIQFQIRQATANDESVLLPMAEAFHREDGHPLAASGPQTIRALLAGSPLGRIFLIESASGGAIGYFALCFTMSLEFGGLVVILDDFYLQPGSRGRGVGAKLLGEIETLARGWQAVQIFLEVEDANQRARQFYERHGFRARHRGMMDKQLGR